MLSEISEAQKNKQYCSFICGSEAERKRKGKGNGKGKEKKEKETEGKLVCISLFANIVVSNLKKEKNKKNFRETNCFFLQESSLGPSAIA